MSDGKKSNVSKVFVKIKIHNPRIFGVRIIILSTLIMNFKNKLYLLEMFARIIKKKNGLFNNLFSIDFIMFICYANHVSVREIIKSKKCFLQKKKKNMYIINVTVIIIILKRYRNSNVWNVQRRG
jgi:hypothetical protein